MFDHHIISLVINRYVKLHRYRYKKATDVSLFLSHASHVNITDKQNVGKSKTYARLSGLRKTLSSFDHDVGS